MYHYNLIKIFSSELAELHKESAHKQSQAKEFALSAEVLAKEELRVNIDREKRKAVEEQERLAIQVSITTYSYEKISLHLWMPFHIR